MKIMLASLIIFCLVPVFALAQPSIYAPDGTYLGQLSNNPYAPDSTGNPYGQYGSPYSPNSINNPYGTYGSPYSSQSPNNPYTAGNNLVIQNSPSGGVVCPQTFGTVQPYR